MSSGKRGCIRTMWLYSGKLVVFGQDDYICVKVVVFRQKWLYSDKRGCFRSK